MIEWQINGNPFKDEPDIQIGLSDEGSYFFNLSLEDAKKFAEEIAAEVEYATQLRAANQSERRELIAKHEGFPDWKTYIAQEFAKLKPTDKASPSSDTSCTPDSGR